MLFLSDQLLDKEASANMNYMISSVVFEFLDYLFHVLCIN